MYKEGDITETGWEIVEVTMKPLYKMRKRVIVNQECWKEEYIGKQGWWYFDSGFNWVELDEYPKKQIKFRDVELDY
jgi:hypothetical protein